MAAVEHFVGEDWEVVIDLCVCVEGSYKRDRNTERERQRDRERQRQRQRERQREREINFYSSVFTMNNYILDSEAPHLL